MPYIAKIRPEYVGRFASETEWAKMIKDPEKRPAEPTPATALPIMKAVELGAAPQIRDPTSKMPKVMR